jgi:hypothetical protein
LRLRASRESLADWMLTKLSRTDEVVMQPTEEVADDADALSPFIGLANGLLAAVVVWALLSAGVLAAYQLAPSWVAATVRSVLLAQLP